MNIDLERILQISALILSIVNALMLLRQYIRDKALLQIKPIHPEDYQWWFRLPEYEKVGEKIRGYGILAYVGIGNRGLRKVSLASWRLHITDSSGNKQILKPISIPDPSFSINLPNGDTYTKILPVLGIASEKFKGETIIDSGCSIIGWAYFVVEFPLESKLDLRIEGSKAEGIFQVEDIFGRKTRSKMVFTEITLDKAKGFVKGIEILH